MICINFFNAAQKRYVQSCVRRCVVLWTSIKLIAIMYTFGVYGAVAQTRGQHSIAYNAFNILRLKFMRSVFDGRNAP